MRKCHAESARDTGNGPIRREFQNGARNAADFAGGLFVTYLLHLTNFDVFLAVLAQQLGLPIPSVIFLMAAGAEAANGRMRWSTVVVLSTMSCLAGDGVWFWIGRRWGTGAVRLLCRLSADPRGALRDAEGIFSRYGLQGVCLAKFVPGLDAIMPPLGGAQGVSAPRFFALDAVGSVLWSGSYVGLGFLFSNQLDRAIAWVQQCGTALGAAVLLPLGLYASWRGLVLLRMMLELRRHRISPPVLAHRLESGHRVAVLDLANFERDDDRAVVEAIPGAFGVDPTVLSKAPCIDVPEDINVVLCCPSENNAVSARAAVGLKRIGVDNLWVLEGGLKAWREQGFPVAQSLEVPEAVAERFGVQLPEPLDPPRRDDA